MLLQWMTALGLLLGALVWASPASANGDPCDTVPAPLVANTFVSCWDTRNTEGAVSSNANSVVLPLVAGGTYNFTVNWGDGSPMETITTNSAIHTYVNPGQYWITITGTITGFAFNNAGDRLKLIDIARWGPLALGNSGGYFHGAANFNVSASDAPDLTGTTTLLRAFKGAAVFNAPIGGWDVSGVTSLEETFGFAGAFNQDVSAWNTSNVTNMQGTFSHASSFNQDLSAWNTTNVTSMQSMFQGAGAFNRPIGTWNVGSVQTMMYMFFGADSFNQNLSGWVTSSLNDLTWTFFGARSFNNGGQALAWDVSDVTSFSNTFEGAWAFNQPLPWTIRTATSVTMHSMFHDARSFNQDLSTWDMSAVNDTSSMFRLASSFNNAGQPLTWDDSMASVSNMEGMFFRATSFAQEIGGWKITSVTNMADMFDGVTLPPAVYDDLLIGWASQPVQSGVTFDGGSSRYTSAAAAARAVLDDTRAWTMTDGGAASVPQPPTGVSASMSAADVVVSWSAPLDTGGLPITEYSVAASPADDTCVSSSALTCQLDGLVLGQAYTFTVTASNALGPSGASTPSASFTPLSVPAAPTAVSAVILDDTTVTVSWTAPAVTGGTPITSYIVTSVPGGWTCTTVNLTACEVDSLTPGTSYVFSVQATNAEGPSLASSPSNAVIPGAADPAPDPSVLASPPLEVTARAGSGSVIVTWSPPDSQGSFPVTNYRARSTPVGGSCLVAADLQQCSMNNLTVGTRYTIQVRALTGSGWSDWSTPSNVVSPERPETQSIMITGARQGRSVLVVGRTTGLVGETITPRYRLDGERTYRPGRKGITVDMTGSFNWQRRSSRSMEVRFVAAGVASNTIALPPHRTLR